MAGEKKTTSLKPSTTSKPVKTEFVKTPENDISFPITLPANNSYSSYWPARDDQKKSKFYKANEYTVSVKHLRGNDDFKALVDFYKQTSEDISKNLGQSISWKDLITNFDKTLLSQNDYVLLKVRYPVKATEIPWITPKGEEMICTPELIECHLGQYKNDTTYEVLPKFWVQKRDGKYFGGATLELTKITTAESKFTEDEDFVNDNDTL